jgi:malonate transporter and related proteins
LVPGAIWVLMLLLGVNTHTVREAVLTLAIPTPSLPVILAVQYRTAEQEMASTLFFSTIISVVSMGVFIWITA